MLRFNGETSFLRSWSYVTPIGHWQGKVESGADLAGMSGWQNFAKWKEMYHSGAEEAAIRSTLPFRRIGFADIGKTRVKGKKKPTWKEDYRNHLAQSMESGRCACIIFDPTRVMRVLPQTIRMSKRVGLRSEAAKQRHKWVEFELHTVSPYGVKIVWWRHADLKRLQNGSTTLGHLLREYKNRLLATILGQKNAEIGMMLKTEK